MSTRQKGRVLQEYIAKAFKKIHPYVFSRADSGSGKTHKEDVTLPDFIPLHIEAKNWAKGSPAQWWFQTINGCPRSKCPVLIYRLNYDKKPTVYMKLTDIIFIVAEHIDLLKDLKVKLDFDDFMSLVGELYKNGKR